MRRFLLAGLVAATLSFGATFGLAVNLSFHRVTVERWKPFGTSLMLESGVRARVGRQQAVIAARDAVTGGRRAKVRLIRAQLGYFTDINACTERGRTCVPDFRQVPAWVVRLQGPSICAPGTGTNHGACTVYAVIDSRSGRSIDSWME